MCQRSVDELCLAGNLILLVLRLGTECAHIVQAVSNLDEHNAYIVGHGKQQFAEVLCLFRDLITE